MQIPTLQTCTLHRTMGFDSPGPCYTCARACCKAASGLLSFRNPRLSSNTSFWAGRDVFKRHSIRINTHKLTGKSNKELWEELGKERQKASGSLKKKGKKCACVTLPGFQKDREVRGQSMKKCLTAGCREWDGASTRDTKTAKAPNQWVTPAGSRWPLSEEELNRKAEEGNTWRIERRPRDTKAGEESSRENLKKKRINFRFPHPLEDGHFKAENCLRSRRIWNWARFTLGVLDMNAPKYYWCCSDWALL